jgi:hypothetical protein
MWRVMEALVRDVKMAEKRRIFSALDGKNNTA